MKYRQLDTIVSIDPGRQIVARRTLRADEEHLLDHFPRFPVMPGVMMLEALHQAAMWLVRVSEEFSNPLVLLREVRGVKFGDFLAPSETLDITATMIKSESLADDCHRYSFKAAAAKDGKTTVSARLVLESAKIVTDSDPRAGENCRRMVHEEFVEIFGTPPTTK